MTSESLIFEKGEKITNNYFLGTAWLKMLCEDENTFNCAVANVTFEKGARNNWHKHPGGQVLLVISGNGYYQEEGKEVRHIKKGDVVLIYPNIKHWHGATAVSEFSHIAITTDSAKGGAEWLEPVEDKYYNELK